jgi:asparagine synthase (glutamine-hydrolysing)
MCGLAGYVGISAVYGHPILELMALAQTHRGPDGEGFFTHELLGLAHRRLAVIDREHGDQPVRSPDGRYVMVYNGEVYNFRALRDELTGMGHRFHTSCDTEVVLAAYVEWGVAAFDRFNGMFAVAVADTVSGNVVLARDHFGIKPLYLAQDGDGRVVFASEIRAILASGVVDRKPDEATLYRYLQFRVHDDTERTFFAGITRLLPGEYAVVTPNGQVRRDTYTTLQADMRRLAADPQPYNKAAQDRFARMLRESVRDRLVSDVPVGTALSGGLDSSTIVATINELLAESDGAAVAVGTQQNTFSAVFPGERNDEERYVDAVAERCDNLTVHKVHPNPDQFLSDLLDFVRTQEEPVISTGPYAQYCVMREASRHVTVMLDGQGADEMMAGYSPYFLVHLRERRKRSAAQAGIELASSLDVLWRLGRFRVADKVRRRRTVPITRLLSGEFVRAHAGERFDIVADDIKARLEDDLFRHSLPALLRYEDRNTMRFSIEGRVPFLDVNLMRALWGLDSTAILHGGWNKRALRDATVRLLPSLINRRRNKIGFTTPEEAWFRRIKNYVYGVFASDEFAARPYFNSAAVLSAFESYLAGRGSTETMMFWRLLNVELWLREFIDKDPTALQPESGGADDLAFGLHAQAPPKSDYLANADKQVTLGTWARFPLRVDLVAPGDDVTALGSDRVAQFFAGMSEAPAEVQTLTADGRWYLFVSEKVVAISQGRIHLISELRTGPWARLLSGFVVRTPWGIGLGHPATMQLAISEVGLPRILLASAASAAGKFVGKRGVFYRVAGPAVRAIDGPTQYSAYPANVSAKLAPADPAGVARSISAAVRAAVKPDLAARFGGTVVIDANDIGQNILGHDTAVQESTLEAAFADNPLGQGREQTPFAVVFDTPATSRVPSQRGSGQGLAGHAQDGRFEVGSRR